jgi:hypothetical protein
MTIHRVISWVLIVLIIAPLHIAIVTLRLFYRIFNNLHYINFYKNVVPDYIAKDFIKHELILKIYLIIVASFIEYFKELKMLKSCKF